MTKKLEGLPDECLVVKEEACPLLDEQSSTIFWTKRKLIGAFAAFLTSLAGAITYFTVQSGGSAQAITPQALESTYVKISDFHTSQQNQDALTNQKLDTIQREVMDLKSINQQNTQLLYKISGKLEAQGK